MTTHLPESVYIGAKLGPATVHLRRELVERYNRVTRPDSDDGISDLVVLPTMLESYMNRLAVLQFKYLDYGVFHAKTGIHYIRPIPVDSTITLTGELVDLYSKGRPDYLVIRFLTAGENDERLLEMEVHHLVNYRGGELDLP